MADDIEILANRIQRSQKLVAFTGAGISTESGISDYRSKGGLWDRFQPITIDEFMASKKARIEYWRRKLELYDQLDRARPNPAHTALADFYQKGLLKSVITQNVDGLHQAAGLPDEAVIELHGNTLRVRCMHCGGFVPLEDALDRIKKDTLAPDCECGGFLKPDTISFGQSLPQKALQQAISLSQACDMFLAIGSTLIVQPASLMPGYAKRAGAFLAIVNMSETPYDTDCDLLIRDQAGRVMAEVKEIIDQKTGASFRSTHRQDV